MTDYHSKLLSRIEAKRRELELAVDRIKRDHSGLMNRDADLVQKNLDHLEELLGNGLEDVSGETIKTLEEWLPRR